MNLPIQEERFSQRYFDNYDGPGRDYGRFMSVGVTDPALLARHLGALGLGSPVSMLDLGAADGSALLHFQQSLPSLSVLHGIEISRFAHDRRRIETIALGDMRDVLAAPPDWMQGHYDLILMAAAMYFQEKDLAATMRQVRGFCRPTSIVLAITPGQCFPDGLFEYSEMASRALGPGAHVLIRPKLWWLRMLSEAGFKIVGDILGYGILLQVDDRQPEWIDMGNAGNVAAEFRDRLHDGHEVCDEAVRLTFARPAATMDFSFSRQAGFKQHSAAGVCPDDPAFIDLVRDALAYARTGALGPVRRIEFLPTRLYAHVAGAICEPVGDAYRFRADPNF